MTSQYRITNPIEFNKWAKKSNYKTFIIQFKLDGISIEVQYENGGFQYAITCGDGKIGDDEQPQLHTLKFYKDIF
ncbi:MAG: hypothetical protein ACFFAQ_06720 [Promethearchaeota archaeon]